ncbi:MAG: substrate-binding domain-containing protein [Clostridiales bacterium]|jgi:phosphate transport system substrate-binding protein|nr:substrate-binding domain-containing protein [Clostridiales bacterium]
MKKKFFLLFFVMGIIIFCGCDKNISKISVISREEGSGTRGAFVDILDLRRKFGETIKDMTTKDSIIANKMDVVLVNVVSDKNAIGYVSFNAANSNVKPLKIDGISPTEENIKNNLYDIVRSFGIVLKNQNNDLINDFISYIFSKDGQIIVEEDYIPIEKNLSKYEEKDLRGKIYISGSSSVAPLIEKIVEKYLKVNKNIVVEMQISDSTSGILSVIDGSCDIALSSREINDEEKRSGLKKIDIAIDGLAIIVNNKNKVENITKENVKKIFSGEITDWNYFLNF